MATELEIKLTLTEQTQVKALRWLRAQPEASDGPCKVLINRYYDTADAALNDAKAALRVREAGGRYIQTLKTQGEFVDGAHRREEWEWELPSADLDLSLLEQTSLSRQLDLTELKLAFETNFTRQVVMLNIGDAVIEVAVDTGEIVGDGAARPLHEVEFELKSGQPELLITWARSLAHEVPVFLNLVSKAEQGYHLAGIYQPKLGARSNVLSVTEFLYQLSLAWLLRAPVTFSSDSLLKIEEAAQTVGMQSVWERLVSGFGGNETVEALLQRAPGMGELQLAIASVR
ncbi:CYTH domain-containing protein [Marinobacter sp.]|uniref:CYTH domain-containing protein n=1 Tax=Marinobacter sp. TaxID=50741 RepID=UPI003565E3D4